MLVWQFALWHMMLTLLGGGLALYHKVFLIDAIMTACMVPRHLCLSQMAASAQAPSAIV